MPTTLMDFVERKRVMREWFENRQFDALDAMLERLHVAHLEHNDIHWDYHLCLDLGVLLDFPVVDAPACLAQLDAWQVAAPRPYHQALFRTLPWCSIAHAIRGEDWAENVHASQWIGAQLARDTAMVCALHAVDLHIRPVYAYRCLMKMAAAFGEPEWLLALASGESGNYPPESHWRPEEQAQGFALFQAHGGKLPTVPDRLPARLPRRTDIDFDDGKTYWFLCGLHAHPDDLGLLNDYLYFLYPRWGGSHEQMRRFIDGPRCAGLTTQARNYLEWTKALDILESTTVAVDDDEGFAQLHGLFDRLLELDLADDTGADVHLERARLLVHQVKDSDKYRLAKANGTDDGDDERRYDETYAHIADAVAIMHGWRHLSSGDDFATLAQATIRYGKIPDTSHIWPLVLTRAEAHRDDPRFLICAALGRQFGHFGMPMDQAMVAPLLDRALLLACARRTPVPQMARDLWEAGMRSSASFLLH